MDLWTFSNACHEWNIDAKSWYWIRVDGQRLESRGGPFRCLLFCIADAMLNGFDENDLLIPPSESD